MSWSFFFFTETATTEIYTLSLHDALPISLAPGVPEWLSPLTAVVPGQVTRSEEHTSELQSRFELVCRLLLEKKNPHAYGARRRTRPCRRTRRGRRRLSRQTVRSRRPCRTH